MNLYEGFQVLIGTVCQAVQYMSGTTTWLILSFFCLQIPSGLDYHSLNGIYIRTWQIYRSLETYSHVHPHPLSQLSSRRTLTMKIFVAYCLMRFDLAVVDGRGDRVEPVPDLNDFFDL